MMRRMLFAVALLGATSLVGAEPNDDRLRTSELYWVKGTVAYRVGAEKDITTFDKRLAQGWTVESTVPASTDPMATNAYVVLKAPQKLSVK